MLYVRSKKYGYELDTSFFLKNGNNFIGPKNLHTGDTFKLLLDVTGEQVEAINEMKHVGLSANYKLDFSDRNKSTGTVFIPFRIVEISHCFSWHEVGLLGLVDSSVYIEAESGYWEDVFRWLCMGERPPWVHEDEEAKEGE